MTLVFNTTVLNHKCLAYFKGKDGEGTCDTQCQWYREGSDCPWWFTEAQWEYIQHHSNSGKQNTEVK